MTIDNSGVAIAGELTANGVSLSEMAATLATLQDEVATLRQLVNVITPPPGFPPPPGSPPPSPPPPLAPPASPLPEGCVQSNFTNELVCADCTITATQTGVDCLRLMLDWTVPSGVTTLTAKGWGGGGVSGSDHSGPDGMPSGGGGGAFSGTLATTPGETLTLAINLYCPPYDASCYDVAPYGTDGGRSYAGSGYTGIFRQDGASYVPLVIAAGGASIEHTARLGTGLGPCHSEV